MESHIESLWVFALVSKWNTSFSPLNLALSLVVVGLAYLAMSFIFWSFPGGPAWGKYYLYQWMKVKKHYSNTSCNMARVQKGTTSIVPAGPRGLPIIGSMTLMSKHNYNLPHHNIASMAEFFRSKRLMAFSLGCTRVVVTCDPDVAKEILNSPVFADRPVEESAYGLMFNRSIGFAPYGFYWRTLRRISATHLFCPKQIKAGESQRLVIASQMVSTLADHSYCNKGGTIRKVLKSSSLNSMMCSVFGREVYGKNTEVLDELISLVNQGYELLGTLNWGDHLSWLRHFDFQKVRFRCSKIVPKVSRIVSRIIADHRAQNSDEMNRGFVDVLLSLQGSDKLSESDMIAVLWEMIFRGTDTVAVLMEWILARMVLHPDVQSKVHDELDNVVGRSRAVQESDISSMVYLPAVVKEVLRLHPPGPLLAWARMSITDTTVDGYHVPGGTTAMVNMWAISRDPQVWADPNEFNPDRFAANEGEVEFSVFGSDLRLAPFGSGRRVCPGKALGLTTVSFWVASLLHEFNWLPSVQDPVDLTEVMKLSCEMRNPLHANVCPRRKSTM